MNYYIRKLPFHPTASYQAECSKTECSNGQERQNARQFEVGLPGVPYFTGRPVFGGLCPASEKCCHGTLFVPYFCSSCLKYQNLDKLFKFTYVLFYVCIIIWLGVDNDANAWFPNSIRRWAKPNLSTIMLVGRAGQWVLRCHPQLPSWWKTACFLQRTRQRLWVSRIVWPSGVLRSSQRSFPCLHHPLQPRRCPTNPTNPLTPLKPHFTLSPLTPMSAATARVARVRTPPTFGDPS